MEIYSAKWGKEENFQIYNLSFNFKKLEKVQTKA